MYIHSTVSNNWFNEWPTKVNQTVNDRVAHSKI